MHRRSFLSAASVLSLPSVFAQPATSPIEFIVPFPPGSADAVCRVLQPGLERTLGQSIVIENRPGAAATIGYGLGAKAAPDGNTIVFVSNSLVIATKLRANLPFDGYRAFQPIALMVVSPQVIAVSASRPWQTFADFVSDVKARPASISMATLGPATTQHIAAEMLFRMVGMRVTYAPYNGSVLAAQAASGGHVDSFLGNFADCAPMIEAGKLRPLAVTTRTRLEVLPQVPTVAESGYAGYEATAWFGVAAPKGVPPAAVARLSQAFDSVLREAEIGSKLSKLGLQLAYLPSSEFGAFIQQQYELNSRLIDEAGIRIESS